MNIIVLATAARLRGALTIYKQFLEHLKDECREDNYYVFVHDSMPMPEIHGVTYFVVNTTSILNRVKFDFWGCASYLKEKNVSADVIVSLQNTGLQTNLPQVVYYHQPTPLYPYSWSLLKRTERSLYFYKHVYPLFVKLTKNRKTHYVVQIQFMKDGLVRVMGVSPENVSILFPDVEYVDESSIESYHWGDDKTHFIYPASTAEFKRHDTLIKAIAKVKGREKVKIHFTISEGERADLDTMVKEYGVQDQIVMEGAIEHKKLLSMCKSSAGLLFPSKMETLGLPLLEAAACGVPIAAADMDYSHQVAGDYDGIKYIGVDDIEGWASAIDLLATEKKKYSSIKRQKSSWPSFFELVRNSAEKKV